MWNSRRILREIADADLRQRILRAFWRYADATTKAVATAQLAKALHFRDETIRKVSAEKKSELLASRIGAAEFEQTLENFAAHHVQGVADAQKERIDDEKL